MRAIVFTVAVMLAQAASAQTSPADSQYELGKSAAPDPRSPLSLCRSGSGGFSGCGYNSRFTVAPPKFSSTTQRLATGGQPSGAVGAPVGSTARCKDGTFSQDDSALDACAQNGGIADWLRLPP